MSIWNGFDCADIDAHMDEIAAEGAEIERECAAEAAADRKEFLMVTCLDCYRADEGVTTHCGDCPCCSN